MVLCLWCLGCVGLSAVMSAWSVICGSDGSVHLALHWCNFALAVLGRVTWFPLRHCLCPSLREYIDVLLITGESDGWQQQHRHNRAVQ